jgi:hypothetical protein
MDAIWRRAGSKRQGDSACRERACVDVHQMCGDGIEARRRGGKVVQATQRWVRTNDAEVETGLDERVITEGGRAALLCSRSAALEPCQRDGWRE